MKKKFLSFIFSLLLILPMALVISGCNEDPKLKGFQVFYKGEDITDEGKTITIEIDDTIDLSSDIVVKLEYDNNTTKEIAQKTETSDGYEITGIPETIAIGTFEVNIKYGEFDAVKITVVVNKLDNAITFGNMDKVYDGEPVEPDFQTEGLPTIEWWKKGEAGVVDTRMDSAPVNAGHYYLKVTTESSTYKTVTAVKDVIISQAQAEMPSNIPELHVGVLSTTLGDLDLPTGFEWTSNTATPLDTFGAHTFKAKYTPTDSINYATIENIDIVVIVYNGDMTAEYGDTLEDIELTEGFEWKKPTTKLNAVGTVTHVCTYTFIPAGSSAAVTREFNVVVVVDKATPVYTVPTGYMAYVGMQLEDISFADQRFSWKNPEEVVSTGRTKYTAIFTPENTSLYKVVEVEITINIGQVTEIDVPTISGTYTYNGNPQTVTVVSDYLDKLDIVGNIQTNAGNYAIIVSIKDEYKGGFVWKDGTRDDKYVYYTIAKAEPTYTAPTGVEGYEGQKLSEIALNGGFAWKNPNQVLSLQQSTYLAVFTPSNTTNYKKVELKLAVTVKAKIKISLPTVSGTYTYNGSEQTIAFAGENLDKFAITENKQTNAGTYEAKVVIKDEFSHSHTWSDGTTGEKTIEYTIAKADPTYTTPTGLAGYVGQTLSDVTFADSEFSWKNADETLSTSKATYTAVYTPEDVDNYNIVEVEVAVTVNEVEQLAMPTVSGTYTYNGNEQTIVFAGENLDKFTITENKQTNAGTYEAKVNIKNEYKVSHSWSDGTRDEKVIEYTIAKADPTYTVPTGLTGYEGVKLQTIILEDTKFSWKNAEETLSASISTYTAIFTPEDTNNYNVIEVDITVKAIIKISLPTVSGTYTYNGNEQTIVFASEHLDKFTITENKQTNAGTYEAKVNIKNEFKDSYTWTDGTTGEKTIEYTIAKADPTYTAPTGVTGYEGQALSEIPLSEGFSWSNPDQVLSVEQNTYVVVFTPNDTNNYNTVEFKLPVTVNEVEQLAMPTVSGTYTYNGNEQTIVFAGEDLD